MISDKSVKLFIIVLFITHHEAWLITSRECHSSIQYIPQNMTPLFVLHYLIVVGISVLMVTSSNGNIFRVTGHLWVPRWIPQTKASDAELWCFLWSAPDKRLSKQWWGWWFETPSCPLWRQCNVITYLLLSITHVPRGVWLALRQK